MKRISSVQDIIDCVNYYGILPFWSEDSFSAWQLSDVSFMKLWNLREKAVNSLQVAYGKFVGKKATFVSLAAFPHLASLRRDGYDFDSLTDEGRAPRREIDVMTAVGSEPTPSYALSKSLGIKGFDGVVTSLQNKTYLCLHFKHSYMGTALLSRPEDIFGYDFVRSAYYLSVEQNAQILLDTCPGLHELDEKLRDKSLLSAI